MRWDCTGADRVELKIDNGYKASVLNLEISGTKRFRLNRSKGRTALTITAWKDGKHGSKTLKVKVKEIPATQGASILDGVINWRKIRAHEKEFRAANGPQADWESEFVRFTSDRANFKDALILLSRGPYSAVPASALGLDEDAWLALSHVIRKAHECTHFICRRLFPDKKDAVWDELTADAVGIRAAFGRYDAALAERFLGISQSGYTGGRLENYMSGEEDRQERLNALADKIRVTLRHLEKIIADAGDMGPYDLAIRLEEEFECWKQP